MSLVDDLHKALGRNPDATLAEFMEAVEVVTEGLWSTEQIAEYYARQSRELPLLG